MSENDATSAPEGDNLVLINDEQQYSLWRVGIDVPQGWRIVFGPKGKDDCLAYVEQEWTDMRPLSLREQMNQAS